MKEYYFRMLKYEILYPESQTMLLQVLNKSFLIIGLG